MELYKVYARCCTTKTHIRKVELFNITDELDDAFNRIYDEAVDSDLIDVYLDEGIDDNKVNAAYEKIRDYFETEGYLDCGDYSLFDVSKCDLSIPNMGSNSASIIFM